MVTGQVNCHCAMFCSSSLCQRLEYGRCINVILEANQDRNSKRYKKKPALSCMRTPKAHS
jgi:hypothetical protein